MLMNISSGPSVWCSSTFEKKESFLDIREYLSAVHQGLDTDEVIKSQALRDMASRVVDICERGQGVAVLRGLDIKAHAKSELVEFYANLCSLMGGVVSQNRNGDKLVSVSNKRMGSLSDSNVRAYDTDQGLSFHSDSSDITGLLCINNSQSGGDSMVVSAGHIHNLILSDHREFLALYYNGFLYDARGEETSGSPAYRNSVFYFAESRLSCRFYLADYISPGLEKLGLSLSETERSALQLFADLCADPENHISFKMMPGDIVFYSNNAVLHARQPFRSCANPDEDRLLYRTWINPHDFRSFPADFAKYRFGYDNPPSAPRMAR